MRKKAALIVLLVVATGSVCFWVISKIYPQTEIAVVKPVVAKPEKPVIKYGMNLAEFKVSNHIVQQNEIFAGILSQYNVAGRTINFLSNASQKIFNLSKIKAGNNCTLLCDKNDSIHTPKKLVYEESKVDYVVFNLDSPSIYRGQNKIDHRQREVGGVIKSSLYETFEENNINPALAVRMSEIFAWTIDFYKIQPGDKFKVVYDEDFVNGESVYVGEIKACMFNSGGKDFYAFHYKKGKDGDGDYYDENGNSMKKEFLKAPVKFSRISSKYSLNRFHPVTKEWKAHLGTDYAAAPGTPILATADGVVEEAQFKQFNGNYVKIRHNGQYKTQYLHMSKIGTGMRPGAKVKQGQVIGYVGMTGLATGPHVCYRFWKDGQQVDPLKQKLTFADPMPTKYKADFITQTKGVRLKLAAITYTKQESPKPAKEESVSIDTTLQFAKKFF